MSAVFITLLETLLHICFAVFTIDCLPSSNDNKNTSTWEEFLSEKGKEIKTGNIFNDTTFVHISTIQYLTDLHNIIPIILVGSVSIKKQQHGYMCLCDDSTYVLCCV